MKWNYFISTWFYFKLACHSIQLSLFSWLGIEKHPSKNMSHEQTPVSFTMETTKLTNKSLNILFSNCKPWYPNYRHFSNP